MNYTILQGDNRETLRTIPDNSIDAIVTDPPYGIDFLGKSWDANTGALETYQECLRVLKPGGHILAFSAARTYHHLAITLEQAGFEIRDQIMWIYSSGFPKSQDIGKSIERTEKKRKTLPSDNGSKIVGMGTQCSKCGKKENGSNQYKCKEEPCPLREVLKPADNEWAGWGTNLKPAHEPIALARKPIKLSIAKNCQAHGVGALNIDATRVPYADEADLKLVVDWANKYTSPGVKEYAKLDGSAERTHTEEQFKSEASTVGRFPSNVLGEILQADYQKYFYCPKVSRRERHIGFDGDTKTHWQMAEEMGGSLVDHEGNPTRSGNKALIPGIGDIYTHSLSKKYEDWCKANNKPMPYSGNNHPTVKPIELMKYLIKLITPAGGTVLDPFNGSGSTGCAAVELGHTYIGCELDPAYVEIARKRIEAWNKPDSNFGDLFE